MVALLVVANVAALADGVSITINASSTAADGGKTDTTTYDWYQIMEADIEQDPTQSGATQTGGKVAYYVTTAAREAELRETGCFTTTRVGTTDKWYVELVEGKTAADIEAAFDAATFDKTIFAHGTFAQTTVAGSATATGLNPGYYYIVSSAGTNAVIQTLTDVEITEKNTYPPVNKTILPADESSEIGSTVHYTLTVDVPATANDFIILTDTMDAGLDYGRIVSVKSDAENTPDVAYTIAPETPTAASVAANGNKFTITFSKDTVIANQGKKITVEYEAIVNKDAQIETNIPNTVDLKYGNHYESLPKEVETKTYKFEFDKVDGSDTSVKLTGAEFELLKADKTTKIDLIEVTAGVEYRIATQAEKDDENVTTTQKIVTNGNTVTIKGLDKDLTYWLKETKAPTGYNKLDDPIEVKAGENGFVKKNVLNNKGTALPSTGGIGTTLFYIGGGILVLAAIILLVTKKRMAGND